ncbi:hypothetical protein LTR37_003323 [Vermiconidia calcicola]|uniref:Uncharacterized protein n=1 Tax=Vermiconidia calcicola TaxID=1690605 RepID=A0ACC3NQC0_9PEZI|nr:hypothetical protein LTR37_003323 [Vermiconidia calcicola]
MAKDAQRSSELSRVRENQRRSRARRKEYLQELENKYHECERTGATASAELQAAARKVLDENKGLRQILRQQGFTDADVDTLLVAQAPEDRQHSRHVPPLENALGPKICRGGRGSIQGPRRTNRTPSSPSQSDPQPRPERQSSPLRIDMSKGPPTPTQRSSTFLEPSTGVVNAAAPDRTALPAQTEDPANHALGFGDTLDWQVSNFSHQELVDDTSSLSEYPDTSSCHAAADAIRTINPGLGQELEEELGCSDGKDCAVPNTFVFHVMDRYS